MGRKTYMDTSFDWALIWRKNASTLFFSSWEDIQKNSFPPIVSHNVHPLPPVSPYFTTYEKSTILFLNKIFKLKRRMQNDTEVYDFLHRPRPWIHVKFHVSKNGEG